jgi:hypothetical protein
VDVTPLIGFGALLVAVVVTVIIVARGRRLREKEFGRWLDGYRASTAEPETEPQRLRELWTADLRTRDIAQRRVAFAQQNPDYVIGTDENGAPLLAPVPPPRNNILAVLSLIFCIGGSFLGLIFGHIALAQIKARGEGGRGYAIAGLTIGYSFIGLVLLVGLMAFVVSASR